MIWRMSNMDLLGIINILRKYKEVHIYEEMVKGSRGKSSKDYGTDGGGYYRHFGHACGGELGGSGIRIGIGRGIVAAYVSGRSS